MTVRTWVTISIIAAVALSAAAAYRLLKPADVPELVARSGQARLPAVYGGSCWFSRGNDLTCERGEDDTPAAGPRLASSGTVEVFAAYPAQPDGGEITITPAGGGDPVVEMGFEDTITYDLEPGRYLLDVEARFGPRAYVRYSFAFRI